MEINATIGGFFYSLSKKLSRSHLYEWLDDEIELLQKRNAPRILNVGSGGEVFKRLETLTQSTITQIDIDIKRKPDVVADVCDLHMFTDNSFDAVFAMEVMEHVREPAKGIAEIRRVLAPGGAFISSTPFIFPLHDEPYDYYRFTKYGLAYMLRDFKDVTIRPRNDYIHALVVMASRLPMTQNRIYRLSGLVFFIFTLSIYPLLWLFSKLCKQEKATTGYFSRAIKPSGF